MKRIITFVLSLVILLGMMPSQAFAMETVFRTVTFHAEGIDQTRELYLVDGEYVTDADLQSMTELFIEDINDNGKKIYGWSSNPTLLEYWDTEVPVTSNIDLYADLGYSIKGFLNAFYDPKDEWGIAYFGTKDGSKGATISQEGIQLISGGSPTVIDIQHISSDTYRLVKIRDTGYDYAEYYDAKISDGKIQWLRRTFKDYYVNETKETTYYPAYRVWFNNWGGYASETSPQFLLVSPGSKVSKPANPSKSGYTLRQWCSDLDRTVPYDFNKPVTETMEIYALWEFPVHFDLNLPEKAEDEPVPASIATLHFPEGRKFDLDFSTADPTDDLPAEPTLNGYIFTGWYIDEEGKTPFDLNQELTAPLTLYGNWENGVYTIDFDMQGHGTKPAVRKIGFQKPIRSIDLASSQVVEDGVTYTFEGWYYDEDFKRRVDLNAPVTENLTLFAHWMKEVTITYDNGWHGENIIKKVPWGSIIYSASVIPTSDYDLETFGGWFTDSDCTKSFISGRVNATEDLTLYAKWYEYSAVYFKGYDFGDQSKYFEEKMPYNSLLTEPETEYVSDMEVYGWFTDSGKQWNFATDRTPEGMLTLTAKWGNVFRVAFDPNNGEGAKIVDGYRPGDKIDSTSVPKMTVPEGMVFAGWYTDADLTKFFDLSAKTIPADAEGFFTLYAKWSKSCTITIHFDENNKLNCEVPLGAPLGSTYLKNQLTGFIPSGYTAYGWYTDKEHNTAWKPDTDSVYDGLELYVDLGLTQQTLFNLLEDAYFRPDSTRSDLGIFFEMNGIAGLVDFNDWEYERVRATDKIGLQTYRLYCTADKSLNGLYFDLMMDNEEPVAISIRGKVPSVFLNMDLHRCVGVYLFYKGGQLGVKAVGCRFFEKGDKFSVPDECLPSKSDGSRFLAWCTDEYAQNVYDMDRILTENLELYARWDGYYHIRFRSNRSCEIEREEKTVKAGSLLTKPDMSYYENRYLREGFVIKGWYVDGPIAEVPWDFSQPVYADMELYVLWGEKEYRLTFEMNGHGTAPDSISFTAYSKITAPEDPTDDSYIFGGWYEDEALEHKWSFDNTTPAADMTLYAKWTEIPKTDHKLVAPTAKTGLVFDGNGQELVNAGVCETGILKYALGTSETTAPSEGWNESVPVGTSVGTYYVWYFATGSKTHTDTSPVCIKVIIAEPHTCDNPTFVSGQAATCVTDGWKDCYQCSCNEYYEDEACTALISDYDAWKTDNGKLPATGHSYNTPVYSWDNDSCTASRTCSVCTDETDGHIDTETVTGSYIKDSDVTCTSAEKGHYHAEFANADFTAQDTATGSVTKGEPMGHDWSDWTFVDETQHQRVCANDGNHMELEDHVFEGNTCVKCGYVADNGYAIIVGADGEWTKGTSAAISFHSNAEYAKFVGVLVDDVRIDSSNYISESGSTVVHLKSSYTQTLSVGKHKLTIKSSDGEATCWFYIKAPILPNDHPSPNTGDNRRMMVLLLLISAIAVTETAVLGKKRRKNK